MLTKTTIKAFSPYLNERIRQKNTPTHTQEYFFSRSLIWKGQIIVFAVISQ